MCRTNSSTDSAQHRVPDPHDLWDGADAFNAPTQQEQRRESATVSRNLFLYDSYPGPRSGQVIDIMVPRDRGTNCPEPRRASPQSDNSTAEQLPALHQWLLRLASSPTKPWKADPL